MVRFEVKAFYTLTEFAEVARMHRDRVRRILEGFGVKFTRSGRLLLIPLSELQAKAPEVIASLIERDHLDIQVEVAGRALLDDE